MSLRIRYLDGVDAYLKSEMIGVGKWLRANYDFTTSFEVRLINRNILFDFDGTECALKWWQNSGRFESVKAEIAVGSFQKNLADEGAEVAFPTVIAAIGRAVYYYQRAITNVETSEGQATIWGDKLMNAFIEHKGAPEI